MAFASFGVRLDDMSKGISITRDMNAGSTISDRIFIVNPDDSEKNISILTKGISKDSEFDTWFGSPVTITIGSKTTYEYKFDITVPNNAINGIYHGEIIIREESKKNTKGNVKVSTQINIATVITITNGREKPKEEVKPAKIIAREIEKPTINITPQVAPPPPATIEPSITYTGENVPITIEQKDSGITTIILLCIISLLTLLLIALLIRRR